MDRIAWTEEVTKAVRAAGVVDAHHHMITAARRRERGTGLIDWMGESYLASDLAAVGLDWGAIAGADDERAWGAIAEALRRTRFTSYTRVVEIGLRETCGVEGPLWEADWRALDARIRAGSADESWTEKILREKAGLTHGVLDRQATGTTNIFLREGHGDWYDFITRERGKIGDEKVLSSITMRIRVNLGCNYFLRLGLDGLTRLTMSVLRSSMDHSNTSPFFTSRAWARAMGKLR